MRRPNVPVLLVLCAVLLALWAVPASAGVEYIAGCRAQGLHAWCSAKGGAPEDPNLIYLKITAQPGQRVHSKWVVDCHKGFNARGTHGEFVANTPVRRKLTMPYRHPDECTVAASAQLYGKGKMTLIAYAVH